MTEQMITITENPGHEGWASPRLRAHGTSAISAPRVGDTSAFIAQVDLRSTFDDTRRVSIE